MCRARHGAGNALESPFAGKQTGTVASNSSFSIPCQYVWNSISASEKKKEKKNHPLKLNYTFPILVAFSAISTTAFFPAVSLGERRWLFFLPFTSGEQSSEVTQPWPKLKPPGQVLNHLHPWLHPSPRSMSALTLSLCIHFCTYVWLWLCYFTSWCCSDPN